MSRDATNRRIGVAYLVNLDMARQLASHVCDHPAASIHRRPLARALRTMQTHLHMIKLPTCLDSLAGDDPPDDTVTLSREQLGGVSALLALARLL